MRSSTIQSRRATLAVLTATALLGAVACAKSAKPTGGAGGPSISSAATTAAAGAATGAMSGGMSGAMSGAISAAGPLLTTLTSKVPGLSQEQAALAAGSMLALAQTKMPAGDYSQLVNAVPGAGALVAASQDQGLPSAAALTPASVSQFLGKAGISPEQASQLTSALGSAIGGMVPGSVANSFASALK